MTAVKHSAAIISLGTELTRGDVQDTHLVFLGKELRRTGYEVSRVTILPDHRAWAAAEMRKRASENALVVITGGLGPTSDDVTREAVADAFGIGLEFREDAWRDITLRFAGRPVSESNRKQAMIPAGFAIIPNPRGTACGFHGRIKDCAVFVLPGPPRELEPMFTESVLPLLGKGKGSPEDSISGSVFLIGESLIEDEYLAGNSGDVEFHTRLEKDRVLFRLEGGSEESREGLFERFVESFGAVRVRRGSLSSAELLYNALIGKKSNIVLAESCTGGLVSEWITEIPGSSSVFWGGYVVYSNEAKSLALGIGQSLIEEKGAVSEAVVLDLVESSLVRSGAGFAIAVSGIAGPSGGTPEKPVGTVWIAVGGAGRDAVARRFLFSGSRERVRKTAATTALLFAESYVSGVYGADTF